jgi:hypothetical protein
MKSAKGSIGNQIHGLLACNVVPQPTSYKLRLVICYAVPDHFVLAEWNTADTVWTAIR